MSQVFKLHWFRVGVLLLSLASSVGRAESLLVIAVIDSMQTDTTARCVTEASAQVEKECVTSHALLKRVMSLDGNAMPDLTVLINTDGAEGSLDLTGPKLLVLQSLTAEDSSASGASYRALRITTLFNAACLAEPLDLPLDAKVIGPTRIDEYGDASCYLLPLWWAK